MVGICKCIIYYSQESGALGITAIAYESERCISYFADGGSVNPLEIIGADVVTEAEIITPPRPVISLQGWMFPRHARLADITSLHFIFFVFFSLMDTTQKFEKRNRPSLSCEPCRGRK